MTGTAGGDDDRRYERWYDQYVARWTVGWRRSTVLNVVASVIFVAAAVGVVLVVTLSGSDGPKHQVQPLHSNSSTPPVTSSSSSQFVAPPLITDTAVLTGSSSGAGTDTGSPTDTAAPSGSGTADDVITETTGRHVVVDYLNAVNAHDRTDGAKLICQQLLPTWLHNIDDANSDFNFTVMRARFTGSDPSGSALVLHYTLEFNDNSINDVDFTVVDEDGPKICGLARG